MAGLRPSPLLPPWPPQISIPDVVRCCAHHLDAPFTENPVGVVVDGPSEATPEWRAAARVDCMGCRSHRCPTPDGPKLRSRSGGPRVATAGAVPCREPAPTQGHSPRSIRSSPGLKRSATSTSWTFPPVRLGRGLHSGRASRHVGVSALRDRPHRDTFGRPDHRRESAAWSSPTRVGRGRCVVRVLIRPWGGER